jgi:hypothetical protein
MKRSRVKNGWWAAAAAVFGALAALATLRSFGADAVRLIRIKTM